MKTYITIPDVGCSDVVASAPREVISVEENNEATVTFIQPLHVANAIVGVGGGGHTVSEKQIPALISAVKYLMTNGDD